MKWCDHHVQPGKYHEDPMYSLIIGTKLIQSGIDGARKGNDEGRKHDATRAKSRELLMFEVTTCNGYHTKEHEGSNCFIPYSLMEQYDPDEYKWRYAAHARRTSLDGSYTPEQTKKRRRGKQ